MWVGEGYLWGGEQEAEQGKVEQAPPDSANSSQGWRILLLGGGMVGTAVNPTSFLCGAVCASRAE